MEWYDILEAAHEKIPEDGSITDLSHKSDRELAALWRLDFEMNRGGYIQFYTTWGEKTYRNALEALEKIGAKKQAKIIKKCQMKIDKVSSGKQLAYGELHEHLSEKTMRKIVTWTETFLELSEEIAVLGRKYYKIDQ